MARPNKKGLDYFPLNVDFFEDDKIQLIEGEFGSKGSLIAVRLLCKIYKENGYYYQWGEDQCLLFAKGAGLVQNLVSEVVMKLIKRSFFDERVFKKFQILTSRGIQNRYISVVKSSKIKRDPIIEKYDLTKTPEETSIDSGEMQKTTEESTQSKEKQSKEKQSKEEESKEEESHFHAPDLSKSNLFRKPRIPTKEQVLECFVRNGGNKEMAKRFWERYHATGWYHKGSPIIDFTHLVYSFIENWKKNEFKNKKHGIIDTEAAAAGRRIQEEEARRILNAPRKNTSASN